MPKANETAVPVDPIVILYDGMCNLCRATVRFIIKRDARRVFRFAALQSEAGRGLLNKHGMPASAEGSIVVIADRRVFVKSSAALKITENMGRLWPACSVFRIVPRVIRDWCYDFVAAHRYRWFGSNQRCESLPEDIKDRLL